MNKFHIHSLTRRSFTHTTLWAVAITVLIVVAAATLGRAAHNFDAALVEKPDVAIYLLLEDEKIGQTTLLRESENERDYLAETEDGPKLVRLKKGPEQWYVQFTEALHGRSAEQVLETQE